MKFLAKTINPYIAVFIVTAVGAALAFTILSVADTVEAVETHYSFATDIGY